MLPSTETNMLRRFLSILPLTLLHILLPALLTSTQFQNLHVVWYISPNGSTNASSCGRVPDNPCASLELVFNQSELFDTDVVGCISSSGDIDGRLSTTVYFMEGVNFVPSTCLRDWTDLRIVGLGEVTLTSSVGGLNAFFEFQNCSNVSIEGIHFASVFVGRALLYVREVQNFTISNCTIPVTSLAGSGVRLKGCSGFIAITDTLFFGDVSLSSLFNPAVALWITQGDSQSSFSVLAESDEDEFGRANFLVRNCTFRDIVTSSSSLPSTSYTRTSLRSVGVLLQFYSGAEDNFVTFEDCTFSNLVNSAGSAVLVRLARGAVGNTIRFTNSIFTNNQVLYGGGIAVYFLSSTDSVIEVEGCEFRKNQAAFEGGAVHIVSLSPQPNDRVHIRNCTFKENEAEFGAGVFIFNDPSWFSSASQQNSTSQPLISIHIESCVFMNCTASISEAVINSLRTRTSMTGDKWVHKC